MNTDTGCVSVAVVGFGYWGPNLVRNFSLTGGARVTAICELNAARAADAKLRYPLVDVTSDYTALLKNTKIDAVAVATPVSSHFPLAMQALRAGKHVFMEKPVAANSEEARQLIEEAAARKLCLMVDHTFVYTGAVRKIHELISKDELGDVFYYDSVRVNLGLFQHDVSVIWDLAVHDLAIIDHLFTARPVAVSATGISHVEGQPENLAYISLFFSNQMIAHLHVNWLAPVKVRQTLIGGSKKMIIYDDVEPSEKIKVYDKGINIDPRADRHQILVSYRTGDMWAPQLDTTEALAIEARHFVDCVRNGSRPTTDGESGLRVVRILEAAQKSIAARGRPVELR